MYVRPIWLLGPRNTELSEIIYIFPSLPLKMFSYDCETSANWNNLKQMLLLQMLITEDIYPTNYLNYLTS